MRILLTNDDGITAPGLSALYKAVRDLGEVVVVAPASVRSAMSHAITFHRPVVARRQVIADQAADTGAWGRGGTGDKTGGNTGSGAPSAGGQGTNAPPLFEGYAIDGNPADCVKLAIHDLMPGPIDLVLSGMNAGANVGVNVFYSGTVGAAREAAIWGIPAIAVSLHLGKRAGIPWDRAASLARAALDRLLRQPIEPHTLLNLNLPKLDDGAVPHGLRVVPLSTSRIVEYYTATDHPDGGRGYQAADIFDFHRTDPDTDVAALFAGYTTVTPLSFDPTCARGVQLWTQRLES